MFLKFWNAFAVSNDLQQILITDEIKSKTQCIENVTFFKEASGNRMSVSQTINLTSHYKPFERNSTGKLCCIMRKAIINIIFRGKSFHELVLQLNHTYVLQPSCSICTLYIKA